MGRCRADVRLTLRTQPRGRRAELHSEQPDIITLAAGEEMYGPLVEQPLMQDARLGKGPRLRRIVDRRGGAVSELDLTELRDGVEVVERRDANVDRRRGGFDRAWDLRTEHAAPAEPDVAQRGPDRIERDMVDREPRGTVIEKRRSQPAEEPHHDRGRIDALGFDGKTVGGDEANAFEDSATHHSDEAPAVERNDTDVPIRQQIHQDVVAVARVTERGRNQRLTVARVLVFPRNQRGDLVEVVAVQWSNRQLTRRRHARETSTVRGCCAIRSRRGSGVFMGVSDQSGNSGSVAPDVATEGVQTAKSIKLASKLLLSYRFLRTGIVAVVALLAASLTYEIAKADGCWRGSISAYYYSPVQTVFTGGLLAIGLCLIVIQGDRGSEEVCLNVAGMLAPVVAFVPTKVSTSCPGSGPLATATGAERTAIVERLARETTERMQNNMVVYLVVVGVVLLLLLLWPHGFVTNPNRVWVLRMMIVVYAALGVGGTYWLWNNWDGKDSDAHNIAAYTMFAFFGVVVLINGAFRRRTTGLYKVLYLVIFVLMIVSLLVILLTFPEEHEVFILEAVEIALFGAFWVVQTLQFRNAEPAPGIPPVEERATVTA